MVVMTLFFINVVLLSATCLVNLVSNKMSSSSQHLGHFVGLKKKKKPLR